MIIKLPRSWLVYSWPKYGDIANDRYEKSEPTFAATYSLTETKGIEAPRFLYTLQGSQHLLLVGFSGAPYDKFPIKIFQNMGMGWEAYHKGVPLLMGFAKPAMPQGTSHDCCCCCCCCGGGCVDVPRARQNPPAKGIFLGARASAVPLSLIGTTKVSQNHCIYTRLSTC